MQKRHDLVSLSETVTREGVVPVPRGETGVRVRVMSLPCVHGPIGHQFLVPSQTPGEVRLFRDQDFLEPILGGVCAFFCHKGS